MNESNISNKISATKYLQQHSIDQSFGTSINKESLMQPSREVTFDSADEQPKSFFNKPVQKKLGQLKINELLTNDIYVISGSRRSRPLNNFPKSTTNKITAQERLYQQFETTQLEGKQPSLVTEAFDNSLFRPSVETDISSVLVAPKGIKTHR